jgi:hypothetical protein
MAIATAWTEFLAPSFAFALATWCWAVLALMDRMKAILFVLSPAASRRKHSRSRGVNATAFRTGGPAGGFVPVGSFTPSA